MWKDNEKLDLNKSYTVAMKKFVALGRDGYTCFQDPSVEWLTDKDSARSI